MPVTHDISPALSTAITSSGIRTERVESYPIDGIKGHLQVRHVLGVDLGENLNRGKVAEYKAKFKAGSNCPPIGVTRDGILIWGNHRVGGAKAADRPDVPAIVFDVDGADPDEHLLAVLMTLSGRENAEHGLPLSSKDREMIVRKEIELGTSSGAIQAAYGMSPAQVSGLRREIDAEIRLADLGVSSLLEGKTRALVQSFSGPNARNLTNEPFKALVTLTADADLKAKDVNEIAAAAKETGTEDGAIAVIAAKRDELKAQIAEIAVAGVHRPTPLTRLRKAVKEVAGLCERGEASAYRDYTSDAAVTVALIQSAMGCLTAILEVQEV